MKRFYIRKKRATNECDGGCDCCHCTNADFSIGMGPVNPLGGPDKFDILGTHTTKTRKRKRRKI